MAITQEDFVGAKFYCPHAQQLLHSDQGEGARVLKSVTCTVSVPFQDSIKIAKGEDVCNNNSNDYTILINNKWSK